MPAVDPNAVILTGENVYSTQRDGRRPNTTEASFWRITFSRGLGRALSQGETTEVNCASIPTILP